MTAISDLNSLLKEDLNQLAELDRLLQQEQEFLAGAQISELEPLTPGKDQLLNNLRERAKAKIRVLVAMGFTPSSGAPSRFIQAAGFEDTYALWKQANDVMRACHRQNQVNQRVLENLQRRLNRLTEIFRGSGQRPQLYGAKGQQQSVGHTTVLASA